MQIQWRIDKIFKCGAIRAVISEKYRENMVDKKLKWLITIRHFELFCVYLLLLI